MKSSDFSDAEIREIATAGCAADGCSDGTSDSDAWATRLVIDGSAGFHAGFSAAVRSRAAAILAARAPKRETEIPSQYLGQVVSEGVGGGGLVFVSLNNYTEPVWPKHVPITISVVPPQPSALDRLLCADVMRHQPIAVQRAILDVRQAGREVPSALLWRMDLSREPGAAALRAEVIAGRMRARGWKAARE